MSFSHKISNSRPIAGLFCICLALAWGYVTAGEAAAKTYTVPDVQIDVEVRSDGAMHVAEEISYEFDGSFSFAFRDIPLKSGESVTSVRVSEAGAPFAESGTERPGTFSQSRSGAGLRVTWYYSARNESRTFRLEYEVSGVVERYDDVAVLYFKFVGDEWDHSIGNVAIRVRGPEGASVSNVRAWAHGPLHGTVAIRESGVVHLDVRPLPAATFWEGRILYPSALFGDIPVRGGAARERIMEEEALWARQANRQREALQKEYEEAAVRREWQQNLAGRLWPVALFAGLAGLFIWFVLFRRYGLPHAVVSRTAPGDLPSDHSPAVVSYLLFHRSVGASAIVATLLDLANRHYLEIEETMREKRGWFGGVRKEKDYRFILGQNPIAELEGYEKDLVDFLLNETGTGTEFTLSGVKKAASKQRRRFRKWFTEWIRQVKAHGDSLGLYEPIAAGPVALNTVIGIVVSAGGIALSAVTDSPAGVPAMIMGFVQALLSLVLRRHTVEGRRLALSWRAFRSHLKRMSKALGPATLSSSDWSRYLAIAILFGMHKKLLPRIQAVDDGGRVIYPVWYHAATDASPGDLSALADGFTSMVTTMSSTMSSASGTGGGASGGGGGGSGGGGGGAG